MRLKSIFIASILALSALSADPGRGMDQNQGGKLCPNYGKDREGSMYTDGYGPFVTGEFLYWTSQMDGLDLAYVQGGTFDSLASGEALKLSIVQPDFEWDPAFRVAFGYYVTSMDWSLKLEWTRLRSDVKTTKNKPDGSVMNSLWGRPGPFDQLDLLQISGRWDFSYDTLDLTLRPGFFRYRNFALQPEFGLRGAWIDSKYDITSFYNQEEGSLAGNQDLKNDFDAIGFLAKVNMKWFMGCGLYVYANASTSMLYGKFDLKEVADIDFRGMNFDSNYYESHWRVRSNVHLALGLEWERFFMNNGMRLNIHAGYEFINWFNQNQLPRLRLILFEGNSEIYPAFERDDLSISGFTVGAGLEF